MNEVEKKQVLLAPKIKVVESFITYTTTQF